MTATPTMDNTDESWYRVGWRDLPVELQTQILHQCLDNNSLHSMIGLAFINKIASVVMLQLLEKHTLPHLQHNIASANERHDRTISLMRMMPVREHSWMQQLRKEEDEIVEAKRQEALVEKTLTCLRSLANGRKQDVPPDG